MATIEISVETSRDSTYNRMKSAVQGAKGEFNGDSSAGSFEIPIKVGRIKGDYTLFDDKIVVDIRKKPFIVSNKMIEDALYKFMESTEEE